RFAVVAAPDGLAQHRAHGCVRRRHPPVALGRALQPRLGAHVEDRHASLFAAKNSASSRPNSVVGCPVRSSVKMAVQSAVARKAPRIEYSPTKMRFVNTKSRATVAWRITSLSMFAM